MSTAVLSRSTFFSSVTETSRRSCRDSVPPLVRYLRAKSEFCLSCRLVLRSFVLDCLAGAGPAGKLGERRWNGEAAQLDLLEEGRQIARRLVLTDDAVLLHSGALEAVNVLNAIAAFGRQRQHLRDVGHL